MGNVAAPFLAGFSLTVSVITLTSLAPGTARWPDLALLLFMLAAFQLIATVQFMFLARQYLAAPKDLAEWYPDWHQDYRQEQLAGILRRERGQFTSWANVARAAYSGGVLCLAAGLTVLAVPPDWEHVSVLRWAAVLVGGAATLGEAAWVVLALKRPIRPPRATPPTGR
ncbi:hypothetical protein ACEZCY_16565 [Streptacidiphilus sp. N1-12]|uniref:SdpI/YhfL protein family protein n=2 Tax=Streptacidiphilus alkalitolerans TaxID=3342712 RepID=A0ABV6WFM7_9ACTN